MNTVYRYIFLLSALIALLQSCSPDDDLSSYDNLPGYDKNGSEVSIIATTTHFSSVDGAKEVTRISDDGYASTFTEGDKIGVFAVSKSDNKLHINNECYTYTNGRWTGKAIYEISNESYFAYYPYRAEMSRKKSVAEIERDFKIDADQSTHQRYTANDLMTATGTLSGNTIQFRFSHAFSLLQFTFKPSSTVTPYYNASSPTFKVGASTSTIIPYLKDGVYRCLVKAGGPKLSGNFFAAGVNRSFSKYLTLQKGTYKMVNVKYTIKNPLSRPIQKGDYLYSDGSLRAMEATPVSENCIGVVYCVDQDMLLNESTHKSSYPHALVAALQDAYPNRKTNWWNTKSYINLYIGRISVPPASSGWYLPNQKEMGYLLHGVKDIWDVDKRDGINLLGYTFGRIKGAALPVIDGAGYWTSSQYNDTHAWRVVFEVGSWLGGNHWNEKRDNYWVRAILAI